MTQLNNTDFSARSGNVQGFDALARAMRQAVSRTVRGTALKGNPSMAKTLRSRIAAVAVAAVGAGVLVAAPANATVPTLFKFVTAESIGTDTDTAVQVAGEGNFVELQSKVDATASTSVKLEVTGGTFDSSVATVASTGTGSPADPSATWSTNTGKTVIYSNNNDIFGTAGTSGVAGYQKIKVYTPTAGTVTVKVSEVSGPVNGVYTTTLVDTLTVTVNSAATAGSVVAANSTSYINAEGTTTYTADDTVSASRALSSGSPVRVATIKVTLKDAYSAAVNGKTLAAAVSGPGLVAVGTSAPSTSSGRSTSAVLTSTNVGYVSVFSDGTSGVGTITITVGSTTVATETVTFYGSPAALTATVVKANVNAAAVTGFTAPTQYLSVVVKDAAGVAIPSLTSLLAKSSATTVATVGTPAWNSTDLVYYVPVTAVASGTTTITVTDSTGTYSTSAALNVTKAVASTVSVALDKASYAPGEKVTLSVTAKDSNGANVADGTYAAFFTAAATTSTAITSTIFSSGDVKFTNGVGTATFYAPVGVGSFTISLTTGTAATVATAAQGLSLSATANVVADTTAIDAAKAEAAKATAAVAALATTIAGIQTAISALVASTTATLTMIGAQIAKIMKKLKIK